MTARMFKWQTHKQNILTDLPAIAVAWKIYLRKLCRTRVQTASYTLAASRITCQIAKLQPLCADSIMCNSRQLLQRYRKVYLQAGPSLFHCPALLLRSVLHLPS